MISDKRLLLLLQRSLLACSVLLPVTLAQHGCGDDGAAKAPSDGDEGDDTDDEPSTGEELDAGKKDAGKKDASTAKPDTGTTAPAKDAGNVVNPVDAGGADAGPKPADGGAPPASSDGFPRTNAVNVTLKGPYKFVTYTDGLKDAELDSAIAYYPSDGPAPFAAIALSPGFTETKEQFTWWGELLASHGFYVLLTSPNNTLTDQPEARGKDLQVALEIIKKENDRAGSPVAGKIATDRLAVTGHSMGGGGSLWAANALGNKIRCVVPLQPWQPGMAFDKITAPTLILAAQNDAIAPVGDNAYTFYTKIPSSVEKVYAEITGADHFISTNSGGSHDVQGKYAVAFYKLHLEDDDRYSTYIYGSDHQMSLFSRYEKSK